MQGLLLLEVWGKFGGIFFNINQHSMPIDPARVKDQRVCQILVCRRRVWRKTSPGGSEELPSATHPPSSKMSDLQSQLLKRVEIYSWHEKLNRNQTKEEIRFPRKQGNPLYLPLSVHTIKLSLL